MMRIANAQPPQPPQPPLAPEASGPRPKVGPNRRIVRLSGITFRPPAPMLVAQPPAPAPARAPARAPQPKELPKWQPPSLAPFIPRKRPSA